MDRKSFKTSLNILKYNNILGLFPEGSRSKDGTVGEGKKGIGLISILSDAPIIPIAISGSNRIIQKPHKRVYFPKIKIIIGDTIDTKKIAYENDRKVAIQLIVSETMDSIKELYSIYETLIDNIKEETVTPHFQGIFATTDCTVPYKFESLMRLMDSDGYIL